MTDAGLPPVAVFDSGLPPALAFIRSLGRAGVPVRAFGTTPNVAGRYSRYVTRFDLAPDPHDIDQFLDWLNTAVEREGITLIAPTSDYLTFAITEYDEQHGTNLSGRMNRPRDSAAIWDTLFKDRFAQRMEEVGFPVPAYATPTSIEEAISEADRIGYPVVLKPRSHVGVGLARGTVAHDASELRAQFQPYPYLDHQTTALKHDEFLAHPLLQQLVSGDDLSVVSLTGYIDHHGNIDAVECSRKTSQWGSRFGIGTMFETDEPPPFLEHALDAIRLVLRAAIFEFEVLFDEATGRYCALELNPRGFGQMSLSVARGSDVPLHWYRSATGIDVDSAVARRRRRPEQWRMGGPYFAGVAVRAVRGPDRRSLGRELARALGRPTAAAMHSWTDPCPGVAFAALILRHPRGLVRPFLQQ